MLNYGPWKDEVEPLPPIVTYNDRKEKEEGGVSLVYLVMGRPGRIKNT